MIVQHTHRWIVDPTHIGSDGALFINPDGKIIKVDTHDTMTEYWMLRHDSRFQLLGGIRDPKDFFKHDPLDVEGSIHSRRMQERYVQEVFGRFAIPHLTTTCIQDSPVVRALESAGTAKILEIDDNQVVTLLFKGLG